MRPGWCAVACCIATRATRGVSNLWVAKVAFVNFEVTDFAAIVVSTAVLLPLGRDGFTHLAAVNYGAELLLN